MGTWGPAIFSDDLACDVRDAYRELIEDGVPDPEAEQRIIDKFASSIADPDDGPVLWVALAVTESKIGRLSSIVRDHALQVINTGEGLDRWRADDRKFAKRQTALARVKAQLTGSQPKRKSLKPPKRIETDLAVGDVLAYRTTDEHFQLLHTVFIVATRRLTAPVLVPLRYSKKTVPSKGGLVAIRKRTASIPPRGGSERARRAFVCFSARGRDYRDCGFFVAGRVPTEPVQIEDSQMIGCAWSALAERLETSPFK